MNTYFSYGCRLTDSYAKVGWGIPGAEVPAFSLRRCDGHQTQNHWKSSKWFGGKTPETRRSSPSNFARSSSIELYKRELNGLWSTSGPFKDQSWELKRATTSFRSRWIIMHKCAERMNNIQWFMHSRLRRCLTPIINKVVDKNSTKSMFKFCL